MTDNAQTIAALRAEVERLTREMALSKHNLSTHETNAETHKSNEQHYKEKIVSLQARLLLSQNLVIDLQDRLLAVREAAEF